MDSNISYAFSAADFKPLEKPNVDGGVIARNITLAVGEDADFRPELTSLAGGEEGDPITVDSIYERVVPTTPVPDVKPEALVVENPKLIEIEKPIHVTSMAIGEEGDFIQLPEEKAPAAVEPSQVAPENSDDTDGLYSPKGEILLKPIAVTSMAGGEEGDMPEFRFDDQDVSVSSVGVNGNLIHLVQSFNDTAADQGLSLYTENDSFGYDVSADPVICFAPEMSMTAEKVIDIDLVLSKTDDFAQLITDNFGGEVQTIKSTQDSGDLSGYDFLDLHSGLSIENIEVLAA